jgi:uncharacterized membrane protein
MKISMKRISSIDTARGTVMIIMALDHVRDFLHTASLTQDPTNLQTTTAILFFTRWITHLCAPAFVFLSGISAFLFFRKNINLHESRKFFLTRGIWLLILEFTLVNFALWYDIHFRLLLMEVISAIGLSFIVLSFLLKLPSRIIGLAGIVIIFTHNLLQFIPLPTHPAAVFLTSVLFHPNMMQLTPGTAFFTAYPLVPWLGILLAGFGAGEIFEIKPERQKRIFLRSGISALVIFSILRLLNFYGDPARWAEQATSFFTFLSFFNVTKYPPSLLFTLLFIGLTLVVLYLAGKGQNRITEILSVYGRVPLFYFIIHLFLIHSLMFIILYFQGFKNNDFVFGAFKNGRPEAANGVSLAAVYLIWIAVVIILYPVCRWYGNYKMNNPENKLLKYL